MEKQMVKADLSKQMGTTMKVNGKMTRRTGTASTDNCMARITKECGKQISSKALGLRLGLMVAFTKEPILLGKSKVKAFFNGLTQVLILETLKTILYRATASKFGQTKGCIQELGKITKWMAEDCSNGQMVRSMKDNTAVIRKKAMVYSFGLTDEDTMVHG